jgi:hypothetical protein
VLRNTLAARKFLNYCFLFFDEDGLHDGQRERALLRDAGGFLAFGVDGLASALFVPLGDAAYFLSLPS